MTTSRLIVACPGFLPESLAKEAQAEILAADSAKFDRYKNPFESKLTWRDKNHMPPATTKIFDVLKSKIFLQRLKVLTGYNLRVDESKNWNGIHIFENGDFLDIHVDAGEHPVTKKRKTVTVGIYLSHDWQEFYGGHLEFWSGPNAATVAPHDTVTSREIVISPSFNMGVVFENDDYAWHGAPVPCVCPNGAKRIFLTVSYLSNSKSHQNKKAKAYFIARPQDPVDSEKDNLRVIRADAARAHEVYRTK